MENITELFGSSVFDDRTMKSTLPSDVYQSLRKTIDENVPLDISVANVVASAMKDWAIEKGATHYTHWFQPLTGITAEKHDSFITPSPDGRIIMEFSGKELIKGEPDASSFPSGGLRTTFEARGYTAWDPTSCAFVKGKTLYIPTAFCSYGGQALDKKTPLLRSMDAINKQALRVLRLFGNTEAKVVRPSVGAEQEYFLVDEKVFAKREDLIFTGRTLLGALPPKGQELDDHYFGAIKPRVAAYMEELNHELWKLGIYAKTQHNEVAPAQHELASVYTTANIATDHNQITMEVMQTLAHKHGLVCLLHERPFVGVNGSGKHNNWSLATDTGVNLLSPGETPYENAQFLLFLCAVIKAVDDYQDLLRISVATAGNDHRLGANEAPPAVISVFLGEELTEILEAIEKDSDYTGKKKTTMKLGVDVLPKFTRDTTDRNRTSPFAFTGNKFEFRMVGSSNSIADANIVLNTAVAESLKTFSDILESNPNFQETLHNVIKDTVKKHKRIIFNGNGYDDSWIKEATEVRGLHNYKTTPDCMPHMMDPENIALMTSHRVFSEVEMRSRCEIQLDNYCKTVLIEANTMKDMVEKSILPCMERYTGEVSRSANEKKKFCSELSCKYEQKLVGSLSELTDEISEISEKLKQAVRDAQQVAGTIDRSYAIRDSVIPAMQELRTLCDEAEGKVEHSQWPFPSYSEILFSVN